jgi:hypothetical protein
MKCPGTTRPQQGWLEPDSTLGVVLAIMKRDFFSGEGAR